MISVEHSATEPPPSPTHYNPEILVILSNSAVENLCIEEAAMSVAQCVKATALDVIYHHRSTPKLSLRTLRDQIQEACNQELQCCAHGSGIVCHVTCTLDGPVQLSLYDPTIEIEGRLEENEPLH